MLKVFLRPRPLLLVLAVIAGAVTVWRLAEAAVIDAMVESVETYRADNRRRVAALSVLDDMRSTLAAVGTCTEGPRARSIETPLVVFGRKADGSDGDTQTIPWDYAVPNPDGFTTSMLDAIGREVVSLERAAWGRLRRRASERIRGGTIVRDSSDLHYWRLRLDDAAGPSVLATIIPRAGLSDFAQEGVKTVATWVITKRARTHYYEQRGPSPTRVADGFTVTLTACVRRWPGLEVVAFRSITELPPSEIYSKSNPEVDGTGAALKDLERWLWNMTNPVTRHPLKLTDPIVYNEAGFAEPGFVRDDRFLVRSVLRRDDSR